MPETNQFEELCNNFAKATKRILKSKLPQAPTILEEIRNDVINTFNELTRYAGQIYEEQRESNKKLIREKLTRRREKLAQCLIVLGYETTDLPTEIGQLVETESLARQTEEETIPKKTIYK